jgi:predicted acylesterase/phospholipase RssA
VLLKERFEITRPLEEMEISLVRGSLANPGLVDAHEEAILRTALSLARMYKVRHQGHDVGVGAWLEPFRLEIERRLGPVLLPGRGPLNRMSLLPHLKELKDRTLEVRDGLAKRFENRLSAEAIDRELRHKALVLVSGGGGGTGYVYVGVMSLLDEYGLKPELLVGTSIGAILSLFRSRVARFDQDEIINIVRGLSWRKLFRAISTENKYGVPAALRLFLRSGIGRWFGADHPQGGGLKLSELPIRTIIAISGIRRGKLPHPLEFYESLFSLPKRSLLNPMKLMGSVQATFGALAEFFNRPEVLVKLHLGADNESRNWDALDAAGFSSALPGVIHYDVLRDDPRMHKEIAGTMETHGVSRFVDGGLVDNLPCKAAWRAVHKGQISTRNAFILALNGFSMKLTTPLWLPLERLAEVNVKKNRPWAHLVHDFKRTLSPLELIPSVEGLANAMAMGRKQLTPEVPFLTRMLAPLPRLQR